jgi:hypothetical protein
LLGFPLIELGLKMPHLLFRQLSHPQEKKSLVVMQPDPEKKGLPN